MKKKVISAVLAGACALSALSFSATAASKDKELKAAGEITLKASVALATPTINVSVPSGISAVVNPYGVKVTVKEVTYGETGIASAIYQIRNYTTTSNVAINGTANLTVPVDKKDNNKPTITVIGDMATSETQKTIEAKTEKAAFAFVGVGTSKTQYTSETAPATGAILTKTPTFTKSKTLVFADATNATKGEEPTNTYQLMVLGKANENSFTAGEFQIAGYVSKGTGVEWTSADKITLNLVLDITPTATAAT